MTAHAGIQFAAVIAAGGSGSRFSASSGAIKAKQFLELRGKPLYWWSLATLSRHHLLSQIVMVAPAVSLSELAEELEELQRVTPLRQSINLVAGGATRQESVFNGLAFLKETGKHIDFVLVHDAARPFIDYETVERVIKYAIEYDACTVGAPVTDTIKRVDGSKVLETIPRDQLVSVQTPQAGRFGILYSAHVEARMAGYATTDDASILEWAGHDVRVVPGPAYNSKITHPLDLVIAEALGGYLLKDPL